MTATPAGDRHLLRDALEEHVIGEAIVSLEVAHGESLAGIVLACADDFLWLQRIDEARRLDGHCVLPWSELRGVSLERRAAAVRVLLAEQTPRPALDPLPATWAELFRALIAARTLVAVHDSTPNRFWVGRPHHAAAGTIGLDEVLADGSPRRGREVAVPEITQLILGSRYLDAVELLEETFDERARLAPAHQVAQPDEIRALLRAAQRDGGLVHLVPEGEPGWWSGAVVGLTDQLVVLCQLDEQRLEFDGHVAFRLECIASAARDQKSVARRRILERRAQTAPPLDDLPADLTALLRSFVGRPALVSLQDDDPSACFVGHLVACDPEGEVRMRSVDVDGRDDGDYAMATGAVTIVEWGTAYLLGLERLA